MQRIKLELFQQLFQKNLTGNEIDFIIALSQLQNKRGEILGLHYKEMSEKMHISVQAFYDCKKSLAEKGIITAEKGIKDYDIVLLGNDFSCYTDEDYKKGVVKYISTNQKIFYDINWKKLKPAQKLLAMNLLNINEAGGFRTHRISRAKFIKKYADGIDADGSQRKGLLNVNEKTLQRYLKMLKLYFYIGVKDGMYLITLRSKFAQKETQQEKRALFRNILHTVCRRNQIKSQSERESKDILQVLGMYYEQLMQSRVYIFDVFRKMIEVINDRIPNPRKWEKRLKASLFHKLLREELGLSEVIG